MIIISSRSGVCVCARVCVRVCSHGGIIAVFALLTQTSLHQDRVVHLCRDGGHTHTHSHTNTQTNAGTRTDARSLARWHQVMP